MFVNIGARRRSHGLSDLLLECHGRIRFFLKLASAAADRLDASDGERREACAQCRRYFGEALPLHVADEEESVLPRLRGKSDALDAALSLMHQQHEEHRAQLAEFLQALDALHAAPSDEAARANLRLSTTSLHAALEVHLRDEESTVFPALSSWLSSEEQQACIRELRARRANTQPP